MTPPVSPSDLAEIGLAAGREIMAVYSGEVVAHTAKHDGSPVTEADSRAEAVILQALERLCPDIPVVAEEEAAAGRLPAIGDSFFLVDPLDGTREFINRNGEFTVNIALVRNHTPVMGMVYAPVPGLLYFASESNAWRAVVTNGSAGSLQQISVRQAPVCLSIAASRSNCSEETLQWLKAFEVGNFLSCGSSLKFCLIAEGKADLYPRFGPTMEWDTAAGDAVLRAAGGMTLTPEGAPLAYGRNGSVNSSCFANPFFVAFGDPALRAKIIKA